MTTPVSRRAVARTTAWAVPVVAMSAAAPAVSASKPPLGILGSSNVAYGDLTTSTRPVITDLGGSSFTTSPAGSSATFTNVSIWYYLPWPNRSFTRSGGNTGWSAMTRDSSVANITSPTTGNTYYAYKTTFAGPITTASGPSYSFTATASQRVTSKFTGGYYYHIEGTVNGVADTSRPYRAVTPSNCTPIACTAP